MKRGFTLVELLAVIVILSIILAIAIPNISNVINSSKKSLFETNVQQLIHSIQLKILEDPSLVVASTNNVKDTLDIYGANPNQYESFSITNIDPITISLKAASDGKFAGWEAIDATRGNSNVSTATYP